MSKNTDSTPLDLSFDDDDAQTERAAALLEEISAGDEDGVKIYEIKSAIEIPQPSLHDEDELTLGNEIKASAPVVHKNVAELRLEDDHGDDEDLSLSLKQQTPEKILAPIPAPTSAVEIKNQLSTETQSALPVEPTKSVVESSPVEVTTNQILLNPQTIISSIVPEPPTASIEQAPASIEPQKKSEKKISNSTKVFTGAGIFGAIILVAINLILFAPKLFTPKVEPSAVIASSQKAEPETASKPTDGTKPTVTSKKIGFSGSQELNNQRLEFDGVIDTETAIIAFKSIITTPKPAPLSIEQIGRHETPPTWIKKIESDRIHLPLSEIKEIEATKTVPLPVRIYYESETERSRIITYGTAIFVRKNDGIHISITVPNDPAILLAPLAIEVQKPISF